VVRLRAGVADVAGRLESAGLKQDRAAVSLPNGAPSVGLKSRGCDSRKRLDQARRLIWSTDFARAEGLLRGADAEALVRDEPADDEVVILRAELAFWRGQFHESAQLLQRVPRTDDEACRWRGLVDWAVGRSGRVELRAPRRSPDRRSRPP
jgi:hypothetical protein